MRRLALALCAAVLALAVPASAQMGHDMRGDASADDGEWDDDRRDAAPHRGATR